MRSFFLTLLAINVFPGVSLGSTLSIPYTGGMQTGSVDFWGTAKGAPAVGDPADTVMIDDSLRVVSFTEREYSGCGTGSLSHWMLFEGKSSYFGFKEPGDTLWNSAQSFPVGSLKLDSVFPVESSFVPGRFFPSNLDHKVYGIRTGVQTASGVCFESTFAPQAGYNRIIYFRISRPGGNRYGKIMVHGFFAPVERHLINGTTQVARRITIAYALSSTTDINSGPVGTVHAAYPRARASRAGLVWSGKDAIQIRDARGALYNLRGERLSAPRTAISPKP